MQWLAAMSRYRQVALRAIASLLSARTYWHRTTHEIHDRSAGKGNIVNLVAKNKLKFN